MKKERQEKPARKKTLPALKTNIRAGEEGGWWDKTKSWFKENLKPVT